MALVDHGRFRAVGDEFRTDAPTFRPEASHSGPGGSPALVGASRCRYPGPMGMSRAENMRRIKSRGTKPERTLIEALTGAGLIIDADAHAPAGRPDIVFPAQRIALFVDGCQWHGCPDHYVRPRTREEFWAKKLRDTVSRDRRQTLFLESVGWSVVRVWEHAILEDVHAVAHQVREGVTALPPPARDDRVVRIEIIDPEIDLERRHQENLRTAAESMVERRRWTGKRGSPPAA